MSVLKATIENLAGRLATTRKGRICPADLATQLPVSFEIVCDCLDEMVDDQVVFAIDDDGLRCWEFAEFVDAEAAAPPSGHCAHCDADIDAGGRETLCQTCRNQLEAELAILAESNAWPARAVWQHELLYVASGTHGPVRIAEVASHSRMTLRQVKDRLMELARMKCVRLHSGADGHPAGFEFPDVCYPREAYLRHDAFIRSHPSSLKDEMEIKLMQMLLTLIAIVLVAFAAHFALPIPFPILLAIAVLGAMGAIVHIAYRRKPVEPGRIENGAALAGTSRHAE